MDLKKNLIDFYKIMIHDETLLRLLHYKATYLDDDVLEVTSKRPNIVGTPLQWTVVDRSIRKTPNNSSVDKTELCRILMFPARMRPTGEHTASQAIRFHILTHESFEEDFRNAMIVNRLFDLFQSLKITGFGRTDAMVGDQLPAGAVPSGYQGYFVEFDFGISKGGMNKYGARSS